MLKKLIKTYYKLLDEKLENGTIMVLIVAFLIVGVSLMTNDTNASLLAKNNVLEINKNIVHIVEVEGINYEVILKEMK